MRNSPYRVTRRKSVFYKRFSHCKCNYSINCRIIAVTFQHRSLSRLQQGESIYKMFYNYFIRHEGRVRKHTHIKRNWRTADDKKSSTGFEKFNNSIFQKTSRRDIASDMLSACRSFTVKAVFRTQFFYLCSHDVII